MKTNLFSKVAVTMMTVALGAGVVGSISGTVAWFQYSTRSTVAYTGTSAHCTENLQIRVYKAGQGTEAGWASDLSTTDIANALKAVKGEYYANASAAATDVTVDLDTFRGKLAHGGEYKFEFDGTNWYLNKEAVTLSAYGITPPTSPAAGSYILVISDAWDTLRPVTSGELATGKVAQNLYRNPISGYPTMSKWQKAKTSDYAVIPLELRVKDIDGETAVSTLPKDIFISKVDMALKDVAGKEDITSALRLAVRTSNDGSAWSEYGTFSKDGIDVQTYGKLDLNNDGYNDTFGDFEWEKGGEILYGYEHGTATISISTGSPRLSEAKIDTDWFVAKHGTTPVTDLSFVYNSTAKSWQLGSADVKLVEYGISVKGNPENSDTLKVTLPDVSSTHNNTAVSFNLDPVTDNASKGIADDSDPYAIKGKAIGTTSSSATLRVELKIYLEGWKQLGTTPSALWDAAKYIGSQFNVGVRFTAEAHADH